MKGSRTTIHNRQVEGLKKSYGTIFNERSEPLAAYRDVGCNPSRPTIYSPSRHCRFQNNIFLMVVESHVLRGLQA